MDGKAQKVSTAWEGCEGVILLNFHTPCIFSLRRAKERSIRTRPSTVSPRNFVFWFSFLAVGAGISLRPWTEGQRRYQRGGKGGRGYIVKFPHPMHFSLRRAKERSIRTRPSTVSPRNFVFWFSFLAGGAGTSLRP